MVCSHCGKDKDIRPHIDGVGLCFDCAGDGVKVNVTRWRVINLIRKHREDEYVSVKELEDMVKEDINVEQEGIGR